MLGFRDIALRRGPRLLFDAVTLTVYAGQRLGLTGPNGSGKSSLFALVLGELEPDRGEIDVPSGLSVAHVAQETPALETAAIDHVIDGDAELAAIRVALTRAERAGDGPGIAAAHQRLDAIRGYDANARAARLMRGLGFTQDQERTPVRSLSGGWRVRLNLARALMCRSDLLLLDEPTNHLDLDAVIWLGDWLRRYTGTLLVISHDRDFLDAVTTHTAHIEANGIRLYAGNYSAFESQRAEQLAVEAAAFEKAQRKARHLQQFVDRFRYKASKARQAQSRIKALERLSLVAPAHAQTDFDFAFAEPAALPRPLLSLDAAAAGYNDRAVLATVSLTLSPGDRIGLLGANGAGKSTLIKLIAGAIEPMRGRVERSAALAPGYFAQHQLEQLDHDDTPMQCLARIDGPGVREQVQRDYLGGFGFRGERIFEACGNFSGGEKARLVLALVIRQAPNLLLLDEPTNHLDIEMRHALTLALQAFAGAVILVSHDRHLLRASCDTLLLVAGGSVRPWDGDLDDYAGWLTGRLRDSAEPDTGRTEPATSAARRGDPRERRRREAAERAKLAPLRKRLARVEREITRLTERQADIAARLGDTAIYEATDKSALKALLDDQAWVDRAIGDLETQWLELSEALEPPTRSRRADT